MYSTTSQGEMQALILSLHRPQQGSFRKVFLQERIHDDDRNGTDADDCVFDRVGRHLRILGQARLS